MRKALRDFAEFCEKKLKDNDHKGGWDSCTENYLLDCLIKETYELHHAIMQNRFPNRSDKNISEIKSECADIANFAMMIFDTI